MIDDPHRILGVSKDATQEEIKRAYRRKAKEYHPDLHPNDPNASRKMNELNEAYDMLMNPEKYEAKRAQQQAQNQYSGHYGGNTGGQQYSSGGYQGPGGWSSDFNGFDFEDFFGFGYSAQGRASTRPEAKPVDSAEILRVINAINGSRFQEAVDILTHIPSTGRNARWYYLSALAHNGLGNTVQAADHMYKAVQMDPNNQTYHQLLRQFRQAGQTYETNAQGFNMQAINLQKLCLGCCAAQLICGPFGCYRCI